MAAFPTTPAGLSAEWLSDKLGYRVAEFTAEPLGAGGGLMALVNRVSLTADEGPDTLIAKFPSAAPENRAVAEVYDMYLREYLFYTRIAPTVPLRVPHCYHAEFDESNSDFVLLLEDLTGYRLGDQVAGCSLPEAHQVVQDIAALHRYTWQSGISGINQHDMPYQREGMMAGFQVGWPVVASDFADILSAELDADEIALAANTHRHVNALLDRIHDGPLVIAHGDVRLDNIFFGSDHNAWVDFQAVCKAAPEHDLAYFITQSLPDDIRRAEDWVAVYHGHLTGDGIDYPLAVSRDRYRAAAMYFLCYAVVIAGTLDQANERGRRLAETLLGNSLRSLKELDALELIS